MSQTASSGSSVPVIDCLPAEAPATRGRPRGERLPHPSSVDRSRIRLDVLLSISAVHALALLAFVPWLFSLSGLVLAFAGIYLFGTLGINLGYHRLLTHRSFKTPLWLERFFVFMALCCLQGSPASWVATHRMHHQHSDEEPDPHSPLVAFLWGHVGWLLVHNTDVNESSVYGRYARDVCRDPFYAWIERQNRWVAAYFICAAVFFGLGFGVGALLNGSAAAGVQLGASWVVWGVLVRTILVWHITWAVNSVSHLWGYQTYQTGENSRNNWLVALLSCGEGWHNNHHADQRCAAHGRRWWELDVSYYTILLLQKLGLATAVVKPDRATGHAPRGSH